MADAVPAGGAPEPTAPPGRQPVRGRTQANRTVERTAFGCMLASGFAGLGVQVVWTQRAALWLGHDAAAVLAVVTAFFGGVALGAACFGPAIERSLRPARWYAACEAVIALWGLALAAASTPVSGWLLTLIGPTPTALWHGTVAFGGTFCLLLPATAAMGATLPAMERVLSAVRRPGESLAGLYAGNTLGAVLGVVATAFWLIPSFGLACTAVWCAALSLGCALVAATSLLSPLDARPLPVRLASPTRAAGRTLCRLAATGLLGIGYEVLVVRVLSQVTEDTVYTYALLLAVYLLGTAAGAAIDQRGAAGRPADAAGLERVVQGRLQALAAACLVGLCALWAADAVRVALQQAFGQGMAASLAVEAVLAASAFLLPTLAMGALFSALARQAQRDGVDLGTALAANTAGAAAAPWMFGVLLAPALGPKLALLLIVVGYVAVSTPSGWRHPVGVGLAATAVLLAMLAPPLAFVTVPDGGRLVRYVEGSLAAVSVVEDARGVRRLRIDNRQQEGTSASVLADARQALLPLLWHPAPRRALFLGLGTGITAASAAEDPALDVDAVELLPEVIAASADFTAAVDGGRPSPRLHRIAADARRYVRTADTHYDVIVADNYHPARSGSGALYTVEHFEAVRQRLAAGGLFCQWLPLHQLDLATLRSIVRSFQVAFPGGWAVLATNSLDTPVLGLMGGRDGALRLNRDTLVRRIATATLPQSLGDFGLADELALLGGFIAGPDALRRFAGDAPLNTDDRPVVAYRAPRITYAPDSLPRDRLLDLLASLSIRPDELLDARTDAAWSRRLAAYWAARDRFLQAGRGVVASADVHAMLAQVRDPLLGVLRISPDFRPAYDPLWRMAQSLAATDRVAARGLLQALIAAQPERPEAREVLSSLERDGGE